MLPSGHEPFVSWAKLHENCCPAQGAHIKEKSDTQNVLFSTWGQGLISRGQRDLEHMLFVIYFVFLGSISYTDLTLTAKSKGV